MVERDGAASRRPARRRAVGTGGYAEYAAAPARLTFPIPDGVNDGAALALLIQGLTAWHLLPHVRAARRGRERRRPRRGRRRRLARGPARQAVRRGPRDRHRLERGEARARARARRRRRRRRHARGPRRRADRGQRRRAASTSCSRWPAAACSTQCLEALAPFGRLVTYGIASREPNEVAHRRAMRRSQARRRLLAHALPRSARRWSTRRCADLFARAAPRRAARRRGRDLRAVRGAPRARGPAGAAHDAASCCSIPRAERASKLAVADMTTFAELGLSEAVLEALARRRLRDRRARSRSRRSPSCSRAAT